MALFDIIEDVSKKQIEKTDTGDSRIMGIMLGKVVKNYDDNMPGKVSVILLSRETQAGQGDEADASRILWARVVMSSGGTTWGQYFIPEVGDLVVVAFEQGNIERAYVIGCIPKTTDGIISNSKNKTNKFKKIVTKNGNSIIFEDFTEEKQEGQDQNVSGGAEKPGEKDKITIHTALKKHVVILDNEKKYIQISDNTSSEDKAVKADNLIKINTAEDKGSIEIKAAKKLEIKVGDNITVEMNGESGSVTITAKKVSIKADDAMTVESSSRAEFKGSNVTIEGSSGVKINSNGPTTVAGSPCKVG